MASVTGVLKVIKGTVGGRIPEQTASQAIEQYVGNPNDVGRVEGEKHTLLTMAVDVGSPNLVRKVLEKRPDPGVQSPSYEQTPLQMVQAKIASLEGDLQGGDDSMFVANLPESERQKIQNALGVQQEIENVLKTYIEERNRLGMGGRRKKTHKKRRRNRRYTKRQ